MMTGIFNLLWRFLFTGISYFFQFFLVTVHWFTRFFRIRLCNWKKCRTQKELDKAMRELGAEVYFISDKEGDWRSIPTVKRQLSQVEEAERKVLAVQELADAVNRNYSEKLDRIKAKFEERRARIGASSGPTEG